jgi:hypothetical protein
VPAADATSDGIDINAVDSGVAGSSERGVNQIQTEIIVCAIGGAPGSGNIPTVLKIQSVGYRDSGIGVLSFQLMISALAFAAEITMAPTNSSEDSAKAFFFISIPLAKIF